MLRVACPRHRHQLTRVDHGPPGLALETDQTIRIHRHAGELVVLVRGEPDLADPADNHRNRAGLADERLEQVTERLAGHEPSPPAVVTSKKPLYGQPEAWPGRDRRGRGGNAPPRPVPGR